MATRPLTTAQLNRTLLVRQGLVERSKAPLPRLLHTVAGLQTQYAPSGYVGLWSRSTRTDRAELTGSLQRRSVIQATLLRATIHMVAARDYPVWLAAVSQARQEWWQRLADRSSDEDVDVDAVVATVTALLSDGPRKRRDLEAALAEAGHPRNVWGAVELWLAMVRVPPSGTWERRRADLYARADRWMDLPSIDQTAARAQLYRQYLASYGPTTIDSIAKWTGIPRQDVAAETEAWSLRHFVSEEGEELVDLPRRPIANADLHVPVRFLPSYDDILLVHARRTGVLSEDHRPLIFNTKMPQSIGTFLVDGVVAGTWKPIEGDIEIQSFGPIPRQWKRELEEERSALAAFHRD